LIIPKVINVSASMLVLVILLLRWLPQASGERDRAYGILGQAEHRFKSLVDGVKEYAIYILDPDGNVTSWNSGAQRIKGYTSDEIIGSHFAKFYTPEEQEAGAPAKALAIANSEGRFTARAIRIRKNGTRFWANVVIEPIRAEDGNLIGFAKVTKDITEEQAAEESLRHLAMFDQLTGLPNRARLLVNLNEEGRGKLEAGLVVLNIDQFKDLDDTLGHDAGDNILRSFAKRLNEACEGHGQTYCTGGDNFAVIGSGDLLVMSAFVKDLLQAMEQPLEVDGRRLFLGVSAGLAFAPSHGATAKDLLANADFALHEAKQNGGRRHQMFTPSIRANIAARREIDTDLRRAYSEQEFVLYYQPQIRFADGKLVGAEALLRWNHPQRGLLAPAAFIDALCISPIAINVGNWILRAACMQAAAWQNSPLGAIRVGVNFFPAQFHDPRLLEEARAVLQETGLPPELLELEITENIALGRDEETLRTLGALRELGVGLAFDDFGTGYASLSYLTRYPLTRIKIDRSFISKITEDSPAIETAVVRSIITMARNLDLEVIAEGVETNAQADYLRGRKCEEGQGYRFGKPLAIEQFNKLREGGMALVNSRRAQSGT
jgi:diguanylate cyclase (GGDEF)-like protein/PAS domain S-box-containing protein